jgi:hypothetical protein
MEIKSTLTNKSGQVLDIIYYEGQDPNQNLEDKILQAVHGFCFYKGKIVVVYAENKKYWTLPGGGIEPGESYEEATSDPDGDITEIKLIDPKDYIAELTN